MRAILLCALAAAAFCGTGCGSRAVTTDGGGSGGSAEVPVDPYGDPRVYEGDPFAGYLAVHSIEVPGPEALSDSSSVPAETGRWSIQVAACTSESAALRLIELASSDTGLQGHVDREGQWWKVRVGGWISRQDASAALDSVKAAGYGDAWVVERPVGD
jgi:hypothetical protein